MTNRKPKCVARSIWEPNSGVPLNKFVVPQRKIDEAGRRITFTISTNARDRDGDIVDQAGWVLEEYRKNPVVLWAHDSKALPVARAENISVQDGQLISVARFATREEYAFADTVFQLYKGGFLNATSVGFMPEEMELIEGDQAGEIGFRFLRQRLLEYSAVPVPSNPEALVVARGKGIDISPCEEWITQILDESGGGSVKDLLNSTYIALKGRLHPVQQDELAARNVAKMDEKADDEDEGKVLQTGAGGEDNHSHSFREGEFQTEPGGEDNHSHAVSYTDDGIVIEGAEGHTHDAPKASEERNGDVDSEEEVANQTPNNNPLDDRLHGQPEGQRAADPAVEKEITDWPQPGMALPVSLLTSEYRAFPVAEAEALRDDWPEIWELGKEEVSVATIKAGDETAIRAREAWAAKNVDGFDLASVVSQVKHLVRGSRGIEHMRKTLSLAKEHVMNERDKAKGLTPEQIDAVADRVVERAVMPAIEKAFRSLSGRVS